MEHVKWQCAQITRRCVAISAPTGSILPARKCPMQPIITCQVKHLHGPVTHAHLMSTTPASFNQPLKCRKPRAEPHNLDHPNPTLLPKRSNPDIVGATETWLAGHHCHGKSSRSRWDLLGQRPVHIRSTTGICIRPGTFPSIYK